MKWIQKLFRPDNGLVLVWDKFGPEQDEALGAQLDAVAKYYRWVKFSEIGRALEAQKGLGMAAIVFINPRKGITQFAAPLLLDQGIPFTVFLRSDCVGSNRLPLEEEIELFEEHYVDKMKDNSYMKERVLSDPNRVDRWLESLRSELGPLPLERINPLDLFATWGSLGKFPTDLVEIGLHHSRDSSEGMVEDIKFIEQQMNRSASVAYAPGAAIEVKTWRNLEIGTVLVPKKGAVQPNTLPHEIPQWSGDEFSK